MRKIFAALMILALAVGLGGCGKNTINLPLTDAEGKPVVGADGKVLTVPQELTDEAMFYQAQIEQVKQAALPTFEMKVPDGQAATLPGGTTITVRAGNNAKVGTYQPWYSGTIGQIITGALGAYGMNQMAELGKAGIAGARGNTSTINTTGDGAGVNSAGGNVGNPTTTVSPTTNTTTTTTGVESPATQ